MYSSNNTFTDQLYFLLLLFICVLEIHLSSCLRSETYAVKRCELFDACTCASKTECYDSSYGLYHNLQLCTIIKVLL